MPENPQALCKQALVSIPERLGKDAHLQWQGRRLTCCFLVGVDETPFYFDVEQGRIAAVTQGPILMRSWDFALKAPAESWLGYWAAVPKPWYHDLLALSKADKLTIEGNLHPLMSNLQYIKDLLALPRGSVPGGES